MRDQNQDLSKLFKLALIVGLTMMIGSAASAATNQANANALDEAAARARSEFTEMNKEFQYEVRERIVADNGLRVEMDFDVDDETTDEGLMLSAVEK